MHETVKAREDREKRLERLWRGCIARLSSLGITIEFKYNKFLENYALHGSFLGRDGNDAVVYSFMQEINLDEMEDVDKINFVTDLLNSARALNLQPPIYIP